MGEKSFSKLFPAIKKLSKDNCLFLRIFSQTFALLGISAIPPKAINAFFILLLLISKLKDAQSDEISSSNLFDILYALNILFLYKGILIE